MVADGCQDEFNKGLGFVADDGFLGFGADVAFVAETEDNEQSRRTNDSSRGHLPKDDRLPPHLAAVRHLYERASRQYGPRAENHENLRIR